MADYYKLAVATVELANASLTSGGPFASYQDIVRSRWLRPSNEQMVFLNRLVRESPPLQPAVPIDQSITPEYLICLEDGVKRRSLARYLSAHFNMTPDEYRRKWGLPDDYPMVAESYAKKRSEIARRDKPWKERW